MADKYPPTGINRHVQTAPAEALRPYLVFAFDHYYPQGGWNDFVGAYRSRDLADLAADAAVSNNDFAQVVDAASGQVVYTVRQSRI